MILEIADIRVVPEQADAFPAAIQRAIDTVASKAAGFRTATVRRSLETPARFVLTIEWETLENHTVDFRGGPLFAQWRGIIGPFFAAPPLVEHFELVAQSGV